MTEEQKKLYSEICIGAGKIMDAVRDGKYILHPGSHLRNSTSGNETLLFPAADASLRSVKPIQRGIFFPAFVRYSTEDIRFGFVQVTDEGFGDRFEVDLQAPQLAVLNAIIQTTLARI